MDVFACVRLAVNDDVRAPRSFDASYFYPSFPSRPRARARSRIPRCARFALDRPRVDETVLLVSNVSTRARECATRCVRAFRRAAGLDGDPARTFDVPVVVAVLGFDAALESVACETARQLSRRGERAVAVVIPRPDASSPRDDDPLRASRTALQALRTVLDDARRPSAASTAEDDDFAFVLARFHRLIADAELGKSRRRVIDDAKKFLRLHRPPTATARAWRAHADHAAALAETVVDAARDAFHPELVGARW
tara:strand:- start:15023 stop:15781 length:759 start_codon:yes stop_codon:yes gene_type:complete